MEKYLNGKEILRHWDIKKIELFDLVKEGLQPYSPDTGKPVRCKYTTQDRLKVINKLLKVVKKYLESPNNMTYREQDWLISKNKSIQNILKDLESEKEMVVNELSKAKKSDDDIEDSWKDFYFNASGEIIKVAIDQVLMSEFLKSDIVRFLGPDKKEQKDIFNNQNYEYSFSREGEFWNVRFEEEKTSLKNRERLRYLIHLLDNPNKEFYPQDLISLVKGEIDQYQEDINDASLDQEGLSITELHIESLSEKDKERLEKIVYETWDDLIRAKDSGNEERISEAKEKIETVKKHLFNAHGIKVISSAQGLKFKYLTRLSQDAEKARTNVQKHISNSKKDIKKHLPSLTTHLNSHIKTGMKCSYQLDPEDPIKWHIRL